MNKFTFIILSIVVAIATVGCQSITPQPKPVIVLTAFGTSVPRARKVFDYIDAKTKARYPGHEVRWAFTSSFIRKKLKKQGTVTYSLSEVIADLRKQKTKDIIVQSLHVVPGQEFKEISQVDISGLNVSVGDALLTTDADIDNAITAISKDFKAACPNVLAGHGNDHHPKYNKQLVAFDKALQKRYANALLCTVEGAPGTDALKTVKQQASKAGSVNFVPLMIVAGDHIMNDVMGNEEDSWKSIVNAKESTFTKPLGYNDQILAIYFDHIDTAMEKLD